MAGLSVTRPSRAVQHRREPLRAVPRSTDVILTDDAPLIPEGWYYVVGAGKWFKAHLFGGLPKLCVCYLALLHGPEQPELQVRLERWYHVGFRHGRVTAGRHSHYRREWTLATGRRPSRADHLPPSVFGRVAFLADVKTVVRDQGQHALIPENQYSIIARLVERVAGGAQP